MQDIGPTPPPHALSLISSPPTPMSAASLVSEAPSNSMMCSEPVQTPPQKKPRLNTWASVEERVLSIHDRESPIQAMAMSASPIGANHPFYDRSSARVPVTNAEKTWLFNYFVDNKIIYNEQRGNIFKLCLNAILIEDSARLVFHSRHVHNTDRLKNLAQPVIDSVKLYHQSHQHPPWYERNEYED